MMWFKTNFIEVKTKNGHPRTGRHIILSKDARKCFKTLSRRYPNDQVIWWKLCASGKYEIKCSREPGEEHARCQ